MRAQSCCDWRGKGCCELVQLAIAYVKDASELLKADPAFFTSNTLTITSNVSPQVEDAIAELLWNSKRSAHPLLTFLASSNVGEPDIPLVSIRSSGLTGRLQIQLREHCGESSARKNR